MKKNQIFIDDRWSGPHGIGQVSINLKKYLCARSLNVKCRKLSPINYIMMQFAIGKLPHDAVVINPGFNNPLFRPKNYFFFIHDVAHIDFYDSWFFKFFYFHIKIFYKNCIIFTDSFFSKSRIQKKLNFDDKNIFVVHCAIDDNYFQQLPKKRLINKKYFLCVGNRKKHKNELMVIDAFMLLNKKFDYDLIFIGNEHEEYIAKLKNYGLTHKVQFIKNTPQIDMVNLYRGASALICPSLYEGFSLTVVEAMASKIPVFASNIPVHREITGGNVIFFDPHSHIDLFNAIVRDLNHYPVKLIEDAFIFSKQYNWENISMKIQKIIRKKI